MTKRYDLPAATVAWLQEETEHSAGKYPISRDIEWLAQDGLLEGHWANQLYSNYATRVATAETASDWPQFLQAAGKHAGVPRGLFVVMQVLVSPLDLRIADQEQAEAASYAALRDDAGDHDFGYAHTSHVVGTPLDAVVQELDELLPRPFCRAGVAPEAEILAKRAMLEGYYYFLHKTERVTEALGELVLPAPGVPSGVYRPWPRAEEFVIA